MLDLLIKAKSEFLIDSDTAHDSMKQGLYEIKIQLALDKIKKLNQDRE